MTRNVPNLLTLFRIGLTPLFIICLFNDHKFAHLWALVIFVIASITDTFDGQIARKYNQITRQGKFLDPLADKILVISAFISLAIMKIIPCWMVIVIIFRDLFTTGLRIAMDARGISMRTSKTAKAKTIVQMLVIVFILAYLALQVFDSEIPFTISNFIEKHKIIYFLVLITTIISIWTGIKYLYNNRKIIKNFVNS